MAGKIIDEKSIEKLLDFSKGNIKFLDVNGFIFVRDNERIITGSSKCSEDKGKTKKYFLEEKIEINLDKNTVTYTNHKFESSFDSSKGYFEIDDAITPEKETNYTYKEFREIIKNKEEYAPVLELIKNLDESYNSGGR